MAIVLFSTDVNNYDVECDCLETFVMIQFGLCIWYNVNNYRVNMISFAALALLGFGHSDFGKQMIQLLVIEWVNT